MKILKNENNVLIIEKEKEDLTYFISYTTPIAMVCNTIETSKNKKNNYGLYLTKDWDYSKTTLKQLYNFIELYTTQRNATGNMIGYMLRQAKNKKEYIKKLIENKTIKTINKEDF